MAQLTYDPTPADQPEFNEAEQEALAIGEAQAQAEEQIYAGKFKDAEALEQAYIELQKKLGESNAQDSEQEGLRDEAPTEEVEEEQEDPYAETLASASEEWERTGELSEDTLRSLAEIPNEDLIAAYLDMQGQPEESPDFTDQQIANIKNAVGGEEQYGQLVSWAAENLPAEMVEAYDSIVDSGNEQVVRLALAGLMSAYQNANGVDGKVLTGKPAANKQDVFRSQAEVVKAMSDPRYDKDPAYRQDVFNKLERSPIQY